MKELLSDLAFSTGDRKSKLLIKALEYGTTGIDLLIETLNDPELIVRTEAYKLLQSIESDKAHNAIYQGILLFPGDTIYCVYESRIQYNDNWWYLLDSWYEILFDYDLECTNFISFHITKETAEVVANEFHKQETSIKHDICSFELNDVGTNDDCFRKDFNYIYEWCRSHNIPFQFSEENNRDLDSRDAYKLALLLEEAVETDLIKDKKYELLAQLWLDAVGRFAFVHPMIIQETTYLKLENNL